MDERRTARLTDATTLVSTASREIEKTKRLALLQEDANEGAPCDTVLVRFRIRVWARLGRPRDSWFTAWTGVRPERDRVVCGCPRLRDHRVALPRCVDDLLES